MQFNCYSQYIFSDDLRLIMGKCRADFRNRDYRRLKGMKAYANLRVDHKD